MSSSKRQKTENFYKDGDWDLPFDPELTTSLLKKQGWLAGPKLLHRYQVPYRLISDSDFGYGLLDGDERVWMWRAQLQLVVVTNCNRDNIVIQEVKNMSGSFLFKIFNIKFDPEYLFRVIQKELKTMSWFGSRRENNKMVHSLTFQIPFNILPVSCPDWQTWFVEKDGCIIRALRTYPWSGIEFPPSILPILHFQNLRPCLIHYVLRYLMLIYDCDSPILEAIFEHWRGKDPTHDSRLFPAINRNATYKRNELGIIESVPYT
jgi:hypothetical protein